MAWFLWWINRSRPAKPGEKPATLGKGFLSDSGLHDLLLLRLELNRIKTEGQIDPARHEALCGKLDQLWTYHLARLKVYPQDEVWNERRGMAWAVLQEFSGLPLGPPPWSGQAPPPPGDLAPLGWDGEAVAASQETPAASPALGAVQNPLFEQAESTRLELEPLSAAPQGPSVTAPPLIKRTSAPSPRESHAFQPAEPSALENALKAVSGWGALLVPFLVQNIGWFIGGFCFVAGSIFLVAYTGGFAKAFTVFAVLLSYSLLLLWGGFQLRRKRPEQILSSGALITLAVLLVPLNLAAAMRMLLVADSAALAMVAILTTTAYAYGCHWAVTLASGMMDRSLQGGHPRLFLGLATFQLAVPVLQRWPDWPLLALVHLGLLGVLGYAMRQFAHQWLHSIFIDRRKIAYYAVGTLVYAALVSFVHTTWGAETIALPAGYSGPFVMALAGLLFTVDAEFKQWSERHAYLSRFSFALYGLSALALGLVVGSFWPAIITLLLGLGIYASVVWRYLTFPPLTLFLACASWLYALLVLRPFDPQWHLLLSLPGLAGLHVLSRKRLLGRSAYLAGLAGLSLGFLLAGLLGWSLVHGHPGWIALATVLATTALAQNMRLVLPDTLAEPLGRLKALRAFGLAFLYALALAYAPLFFNVPWAMQFGFGLLALACAWTWLGLSVLREETPAERWLDCALLALPLALGLSATAWLSLDAATPAFHALLLAFAGVILAWQSVALYARALFYAALLALGLAGAICKLAYFPAPSTGGGGMALALGLCVLSWWLEQGSAGIGEWRRQNQTLLGSHRPSLVLLGFLRTRGDEIHSLGELLCPPLRQAAALLWLAGLMAWLARLANGQTGLVWAFSALVGAVAAIPLAGYFRIAHWPAVPMLLGLGALLGMLDVLGLDAHGLNRMAAIIYSLLAWGGSVALIAHPKTRQLAAALRLELGLASPEDRLRLEQATHHTGFAVTLAALALLLQAPMDAGLPVMGVSLTVGTFFFHTTGLRYRSLIHSYLVLALVTVALGLAYLLASQAEGLALPRLGGTGAMLLSALALAFYGLSSYLAIGLKPPGDGFDDSLYRKPLQVTGLLLAWAAGTLALVRVAASDMRPDLTAIIALGLADLALLLNNRRLGHKVLDLAGVLLAVLDVLWLALFLRHGAVPFDPWNDPNGDLWIILALLGLVLAWLGRWLRDSEWGGTVGQAFLCLAGLLGLRILLPLALTAFPVFLGVSTTAEGFRLDSIWLPVLLGLALPVTPAFRRGGALLHAAIGAWLCVALSLYLGLGVEAFHPPLLFALCCASLWCADRAVAHWPEEKPVFAPLREALGAWMLLCLGLALALSLRFFLEAPAESLWTLLLSAVLTTLLSRQRQSLGLVFLAVALVALLLHGWLWVWLRPSTPLILLPWLSLQWAVVLMCWPWIWQYREGERRADGWRGEVQRCAAICRDGLVALLVGEWVLHLAVFSLGLQSSLLPFSGLAHGAALLAGGLLLGLETKRLKGDYESATVYSLAALALTILAYLRLLWLGLAAPGLWDTAGLVVLTFACAFLHKLTDSTPLKRISTGLPLLILLTAHWELASASASLNLLVAAGLYLWLSRTLDLRLPVYLGLLLFNAAVYLWVPQWARQADLLQIYLVPAAGSVLLMLQLHKRELKPETLNAARLSATSLLYACATLDVFLRPGFGVFLLALALSLASVAVGISLRVRAFVYSGMGFLVLNIAGQLGHLYPEGRLSRAVVLMGIGSAITIAMILFQLKREEVLRRIRIIRADLAGWE